MLTQAELVEQVCKYDQFVDRDAIERAYEFAMGAHASQFRASGDPYFSHPVEVARILTNYRLDTASIVTALLHDTVEDTGASLTRIRELFGDEITLLVDGVTKLSKLELQSSGEVQAENFRKLVLAISEDIRVLLVKLADRLHNMRTLGHIAAAEKRRRIAQETMDIFAPLAERIGIQEIKEELENLSFQELYPDAWESVTGRLAFLQSQGGDIVTEISDEIARELAKADIEAWVFGRIKKPVSIWRKMRRKHIPFERLTDIIAFRVVVASNEDCYKALGIIHEAYRVIPGEFDDYISNPKRNGYRSLHTAVIGPRLHRIEVQIRTTQMHEVAEFGVAAHWQYKQGGLSTEGRQYPWVHRLLEILENAGSADEFLEDTKLDMYSEQVFCFTPKGDIISLPHGATVVDFAYAVHSEIGDRCVGARVNGKMVPLRTELGNGDQIEILTSADGEPSANWANWIVTAKARARLRRYMRDSRRAEFIRLGRAIIGQAIHHAGLTQEADLIEGLCERFDSENADVLAETVGSGNITMEDIVRVLGKSGAGSGSGSGGTKAVDDNVIPMHGPDDLSAGSLPIRGLAPGMAVHYATCCHPLPGDRIVGILTRGEGVVIHTRDCETLDNLTDTPERWIEVSWEFGPDAPKIHVGQVDLTLVNEPGALGKVTTSIGSHGGNISNLKVTSRSSDFFQMAIDIEVESSSHLGDIIAALRTAGEIVSAERTRG